MGEIAVPRLSTRGNTFDRTPRAQPGRPFPTGATGRPQPERVMTVNHVDSGTSKPLKMLTVGLMMGAVALSASACGGSNAGAAPAAPAATAKTDNITMIGKIDGTAGPAGTFSGKDKWPAMAASDLTFGHGDTVVLTIKEYDSGVTALPAGSPYNTVAGGTMTVNDVAATTVSNAKIAHTFSIPTLGINAPLTAAPTGGVSTTVFTFKVTTAGSYTWRCFTPCGGGANGMTDAMATKGWMQGNVVVS